MRIRRLAPLFGAVVLLASSSAVASTYEVAKGSEVTFTAKITGSSFVAKNEKLSGTVEWDAETGAIRSGTIALDAKAFATGVGMRDTHMRDKYLEAEKYPTITLAIQPCTVTSTGGTLEGKLTVKAETKPVKLAVKVGAAGADTIEASTFFKLDIKDYGIPQPRFAVVKMETVIDVTVKLVLKPKA